MQRNRSIPESVIIPELTYRDVREAVDWLCRVFGFRERLQIGAHRSQLLSGDAAIVVKEGDNRGASILMRVADVDRHFDHSKKSGAKILNPPADHPYGERQYVVEDIGGHRWTFSQTIADSHPRDWGGVLLED